MIRFFKSKGYYIYGVLFIVSVLPFLGKFCENRNVLNIEHELFDPNLAGISNVNSALQYIDAKYASLGHTEFDTIAYVQLASDFTKMRFYHGLSHYTISENWIAAIGGKLFWSHLSAIVDPDDILKHSEGLCSQQTIVFMELLKRKHINVRTVGLGYKEGPGHFLCEVYYKGSWRMHDVTIEPVWHKTVNKHESMEYYMQNKDSLYVVYESRLNRAIFNKITEKISYGTANEFPARHMLWLHKFTFVLIYILPLVFLGLFFYTFIKRKAGLEP